MICREMATILLALGRVEVELFKDRVSLIIGHLSHRHTFFGCEPHVVSRLGMHRSEELILGF